MRTALAVIVVLALAFVGFRAGSRVLDRQGTEDGRTSAAEVADAWRTATVAGDVDGLVALASERADAELVRSTHDAVLPVLGATEVEVEQLDTAGNRATATLAWSARPSGIEGTWDWTSELELIRGRGTWSVDWEPSMLHPQLAPEWSLEAETLPASRAPVLDRQGQTLSPSGANVEIGIQPGRLPDEERLVPAVQAVLPEAVEPLMELLERDDLVDDWYYPLVTVSAERADDAWQELIALPGLLRRDTEGGVGRAVAAPEIVGAIRVAEDGTRTGVGGLEEAFDDRLTGSATVEVHLLDPEGDRRDVLFTFQQDAAPPLVTTLDRAVQQAVDDALLTVDDPVGVVVIDPATAGVLAVASRPVTGFPRALEGRYPPAAVAGPVTLAAAVAAGAEPAIECPDQATAGGVRVTTRTTPPPSPGPDDLLSGGCDVALARLAVEVGDDALLAAVATLGLDTEAVLPVPTQAWSWPSTDSDAGVASHGIGHGRVETSALGAAQLAATVARGAVATPVVLADDVVADPAPLPDEVVAALRDAMRTAGADGPVDVAGSRVAGIAARAGQVGGDPAPVTAWWVGFVEGGGRDLAIAVVVEDAEAERAATLAQRILREVAG